MVIVSTYLLSALLAGLIGVVELFQRYRAEPLQALSTLWGVAYVAL